jgi:pimeloyl-ACP methyl ester carboxylesterase
MIHDGIAYDIRGDGDWLLTINGIGAPKESWEQQIGDLARSFRCIVFDNRGMGESEKPPAPYTTRAMADDAARLLRHLGVERAHVLGASMGGAIAQELAIACPDLVDRLVIASSWPACDRYLERCFVILKETALSEGKRGPGWSIPVRRFLSLIMYARRDFAGAWQMIADGEKEVADVLAAGNEPDYRYFVAQADACLAHDARARLGAIRAPTLVLAGEVDAFTPHPLSEALATAIPNATLSVMEGCGHVMFYERPADFNHRVSRFLSPADEAIQPATWLKPRHARQ